MATEITILDDMPILIVTYLPPVAVPDDAVTSLEASAKLKQESDGGPICRILDFSQAQLDFSSMVLGMSFEKGKDGGTYDSAVANYFVGSDEWVSLGVKSLSEQEHYKGANVKGLFTSQDEAIAAARQFLAEQ